MSVNKVIIVGRLGQDPELREFPNGGKVANFSVATSERWTDRNTGERKEQTEWHRVSLNDRLADVAMQYLRKGSQVYIEGSLRTRKWQDQQGQDRQMTEIRATVMQMLGSNNNGQDGYGGYNGGQNFGGQSRPMQNQGYQNQGYQNQGYQNQNYGNAPQYPQQGGYGQQAMHQNQFNNQPNYGNQAPQSYQNTMPADNASYNGGADGFDYDMGATGNDMAANNSFVTPKSAPPAAKPSKPAPTGNAINPAAAPSDDDMPF